MSLDLKSGRRMGFAVVVVLVATTSIVCAQASHLFHTHEPDHDHGNGACLLCVHGKTRSILPVLTLGVAAVERIFLGHRCSDFSVAHLSAPLLVAPKNSPPAC